MPILGPVETLARLALQSRRYADESEFRDAVDAVLGQPQYDAASDLLEAVKAMQAACDEWAQEFTQKKRAMDWGVVNDAYLKANRAIVRATGKGVRHGQA